MQGQLGGTSESDMAEITFVGAASDLMPFHMTLEGIGVTEYSLAYFAIERGWTIGKGVKAIMDNVFMLA